MFRLAASLCSVCLLRMCTLGPTGESDDTGAAGASSSQKCADPSGSYQASFELKSGDCGAQDKQTVVFDGSKDALSADCSGSFTTSDDGCEDQFNLECPFGAGQAVKRSGTLDWNDDGSSASGTVTLTLVTLTTDNSGQVINESRVCSGKYDVKYVKM
jgi:hypothetical protein